MIFSNNWPRVFARVTSLDTALSLCYRRQTYSDMWNDFLHVLHQHPFGAQGWCPFLSLCALVRCLSVARHQTDCEHAKKRGRFFTQTDTFIHETWLILIFRMNQNVQLEQKETSSLALIGSLVLVCCCSSSCLKEAGPKQRRGGWKIVRKDALLTCLDADSCCMCSCMHVCLSVYLSACLYVWMPAWMSAYLSCVHVCVYAYLHSCYLCIFLNFCICVFCLHLCMYAYE